MKFCSKFCTLSLDCFSARVLTFWVFIQSDECFRICSQIKVQKILHESATKVDMRVLRPPVIPLLHMVLCFNNLRHRAFHWRIHARLAELTLVWSSERTVRSHRNLWSTAIPTTSLLRERLQGSWGFLNLLKQAIKTSALPGFSVIMLHFCLCTSKPG